MTPALRPIAATAAAMVAQALPDTDANMTLAERPERLHEVWHPLEVVLDEMERTGDIDAAQGRPVFHAHDAWYELAPAIHGLIEFHQLATRRHQIGGDPHALTTLANKLDYGMLITEGDLAATRRTIAECKRHAARLTVAQAVDIVRTIQIRHSLDRHSHDQRRGA